MKIRRRDLLIGAGAAAAVPGAASARSLAVGGLSGGSVTPPTPPGSPFITSTTVGSPATMGSNMWLGFSLNVPAPITVSALGRWVGASSSSSHSLAIWVIPTTGTGAYIGQQLFGSAVTVNLTGQPTNAYAYATVSPGVVLWPGTFYFVGSLELTGESDVWYGNGSDGTFVTTADGMITQGAQLDPTTFQWNNVGSGGNHPLVPVNFQYSLGSGSSVPFINVSGFTQWNDGQNWFAADTVNSGVGVSGTVTVGINNVYSGPNNGTYLVEWLLWNGAGAIAARSGPIVAPYPPTGGTKFAQWVFDTTTLPDGTYSIYPVFLDADATANIPVYEYLSAASPWVIANHPPVSTATQVVPLSVFQNHIVPSGRPDFLTYTAGTFIPAKTTYPLPYTLVPGSSSSGLRDPGAWYAQAPGPKAFEYDRQPQWATDFTVGGVFANYFASLATVDNVGAYDYIIRQNTFDGTRWNSLISPFANYVEDPAGGGVWWGAELGGRLFKLAANGNVTTVVGWNRNTSVLTYPAGGTSDPPEDSITRTLIGNFPASVDLGGANDIAFDPRDSNTCYVVSQIDHWIAKVVISTQTVTVYAGTVGVSGYTGDGGPATSATFNNCSSIIMSDGTGNGGPVGTMYVVDAFNSAIRKITPGGTISTIFGGSLSPGGVGAIPSLATFAASTAYNVTSFVWSGGSGGTGHVVLASTPPTIKIGYSVILAGATNPDSTGQPNGTYVISAMTSGSDFTVIVPPQSQQAPDPHNGTLTGSMTFSVQNADIYSDPGTVNFSGGGAGFCFYPYVIRFTNTNNIVMGEILTNAVRLMDLSANTAVRIGCPENHLTASSSPLWVWLDVDKAATCGPLNDIIQQSTSLSFSAAHYDWRFSIDARWIGFTGYSAVFFVDSPSYFPTYGPMDNTVSGLGHYQWAIAMSRTEGRMIGSGTAQFYATSAWIKSTEPALDLKLDQWFAGENTNLSGTCAGFPMGLRPSFHALWGANGSGGWILPMSFEDLMHGSYASTTPGDTGDVNLGNFIRAGFGGGVARPEMTGNDLANYIYWIRRGTLQGSLGPTVQQPLAPNADNASPLFTGASITRMDSTHIHAVWTTNKSTIGLVGAGSAAQHAKNSYPIFSDLTTGYGISASMTLLVPSSISPLWVQITIKDMAGNYSSTIPVSIT